MKIVNECDYFYQWDLNQSLIIDDPEITEIHFSNQQMNNVALVCQTKNNQANVPNLLLQHGVPLMVYAVSNGQTKAAVSFEVKSRPRPSSYIYTETEVFSYQVLNQEVQALNQKLNEEFAKRDNIYNQIITYVNEHEIELSSLSDGFYYLRGVLLIDSDEQFMDMDDIVTIKRESSGTILTVYREIYCIRYIITYDYDDYNIPHANVSSQTVDIFDLATEMATKEELSKVSAIAKGRATGYVFDELADMETWLAGPSNVEQLVLGDNLYIRDTGVPDYWWDGSKPQQLETQKVDLENYIQKDDRATTDKYGVVILGGSTRGIVDTNKGITVSNATKEEIDSKTSVFKPIVPARLDYAVMSALTNPLNHTWTDSEKSSAQNTLGITELIGDIETALDSIIDIQNSLISGESV